MKTLLKSTRHAIAGMQDAWKYERNFRIHILAAVLICILAFLWSFSWIEWLFVLLAIAMVLAAELMNTVVEHLLDLLVPHHHETVRMLKDMMAAVVLIQSLGAFAIGIVVVLHHIYAG